MTKHTAKCLLLVAALAPLSGCSSVYRAVFAPHGRPALARSTPTPAAPAKAVATPFTDAGRAQLTAGNPGSAVEAFQHALGSGEPAGPALNGLAVAYARLERFETAQRLFAEAMAVDPANELYAANLDRLLRSPAYAASQRVSAPALAQAAAPAPVVAQPQAGQLVRISANEFAITTMPPTQAAPARAVLRHRLASAAATVRSPAPKRTAAARIAAADGRKVLANPFVTTANAARLPAIEVVSQPKPAQPAQPSAEAAS